MTYFRHIPPAVFALVFLPVLVSGQDSKCPPPAGSVPSYVGFPVNPQGSALPPERPNPIPVETPLRMMQFPPLKSYQFKPVQTLHVIPASDFLDGSKLYRQRCAECHGHLVTSGKRGISFPQLSSAISRQPRMKKALALKKNELHSIVDALR